MQYVGLSGIYTGFGGSITKKGFNHCKLLSPLKNKNGQNGSVDYQVGFGLGWSIIANSNQELQAQPEVLMALGIDQASIRLGPGIYIYPLEKVPSQVGLLLG